MSVAWDAVNERTADLDLRSTAEIIELLLAEEATVPAAVAAVAPAIEAAVELVVERLSVGGTVHAFGAGTSGRLAALDAAELGPTFGLPEGIFVVHLAGGEAAFVQASEGAEDNVAAGSTAAAGLTPADVALGVSASGTTPFVLGALREARALGCATILVSCEPAALLGHDVDVHIAPVTGPEALVGSTRLKAGSATKLVLNALSTTVMIRMGRTYSNFMVCLEASNEKLRARAVRILASVADLDVTAASTLLAAANGSLPAAIVMALGSASFEDALAALAAGNSSVRAALGALESRP